MDPFYYEIVAAPDGSHLLPEVQAIITAHPGLAGGSQPWARATAPRQADLYALLVVASAGLSSDAGVRAKVSHASGGGFPVIAIVDDLSTYDFQRAPLAELAKHNAGALNDPDRLTRSLLHHGGMELFEGGGRVFISYARADGSALAEAIRNALTTARIGATMDVHAFPGGDVIQEDIKVRIHAADLVILIDSRGAEHSPWVAEELDIALAAHVQVIAVTPVAGAFHHAYQVPHVPWIPGVDASVAVVREVRRILARKLAFRGRVGRVLTRIARLRGWAVTEHGERWRVVPRRGHALTVGYTPDSPRVEAVTLLRDAVQPGRGLLVGGVRPFQPVTERGLRHAGGDTVVVAPLPSMASRIPARIARRPLKGQRVFLSGAMPSEPDDVELARLTLAPFVIGLTQALVDLGATLVFGGHPTVTPLIHKVVAGLVGRGAGGVEFHQAQLWLGDTITLPQEVREGPVFRNVRWHGTGASPEAEVSALRDGMIVSGLAAAVFVGGKTLGYVPPKPGIVDEYERFGAACPGAPAFVVGLAGGAARTLPVDPSQTAQVIRGTADPDLAVALIVAELLRL